MCASNVGESVERWNGNYWIRRFHHLTSKEVDFRIIPVVLLRDRMLENSWVYGISKLWNQLQNWKFSANSRSSDHYALDQRSWDCQINSQSFDIAIDYRETIFLISICLIRWLRQPWSSLSTRSHIFGKESVSKSRVRTNTNDSHEEDKFSTSISRATEAYEAVQGLAYLIIIYLQITITKILTNNEIMHCCQWVKCLQTRVYKDCTSQSYRILLNFKLCGLCTIEKPLWTM